jgi:hypothetical protein
MRLSIVALALANVAALPVPKASFLRGAREHPCQIRHRRRFDATPSTWA